MGAIVFICLAQTQAFAYLDPASGSLLLSSIVAIFASAIFALKGFIYKLGKIIPAFANMRHMGGGNSQNSIVFYSEGSRYYFTFKPILDALDSLSYPYIFYTSDKNDLAFLRENSKGEFSYIGEGNKAYTKLNMLKADILVLTAPGLNILHIKRSKNVKHYCHIVHSLTPMTYRIFGIDYFDSVIVANEIQESFVREVERARNLPPKRVFVTGYPFLDESSKMLENIKKNDEKLISFKNKSAKTILISPTWGKESLLSKFGMKLLEPLVNSDFNVIIRPHPQSLIGEESANIAVLREKLQGRENIFWDIGTANIYAFSACDAMISDFSSVIFDFVCLEQKPVFTIDFEFDPAGYDVCDVDLDTFWTFCALDEIGARISERDLGNIVEFLHKNLESRAIDLKSVKSELWRFQNNGKAKTTKTILELHRDVLYAELGALAPLARHILTLDSKIGTLDSDIEAQKSRNGGNND